MKKSRWLISELKIIKESKTIDSAIIAIKGRSESSIRQKRKRIKLGCYTRRPRKKSDPKNRFWNHVRKTKSCWIWIGTKTKRGYGRINIDGKSIYTHRFSYELLHGQVPDGRKVLHKCDNPPCVRGSHLFSGTDQDNVDDCIQKDRFHGNISKSDRMEIIKIYRSGNYTQREIGMKFNINRSHVSRIVNGKNSGSSIEAFNGC